MTANSIAREAHDQDRLLEDVIQAAKAAAARRPGTHGGRYVARTYDKTISQTFFVVLDDDDPDKYHDAEHIDILAQVTPTAVYGLGHARRWISEAGKVRDVHGDYTPELAPAEAAPGPNEDPDGGASYHDNTGIC